jgi:Fe-S cluster assembly iron-binding protein IscA
LLVEPQRTNVLTYSEQFATSWINNGATIISNDITAPDGNLTADRLTATGGGFGVVKFSTWTATNKVASCFVKANTSNLFKIANVSGGGGSVTFNLSTQAITATTGFTGSIESLPDGWFRCIAIDTLARSGTFSIGVTAIGESVFVWGSQLEAGSYATSYIPTTSAAVTRNADAIYKTGISSLINSTEGVLFVETKGFFDAPPISTYIQLSKNGESGFDNSLVLQHRNNGYLRVYVNGSATTNLNFNIDIDFTQNHKIAVLYKLNGYKLFIDGVAQSLFGTPTQTVFSGLDNLSFDLRGSNSWNAKIKNLIVFPSALSDTELAQLTTL